MVSFTISYIWTKAVLHALLGEYPHAPFPEMWTRQILVWYSLGLLIVYIIFSSFVFEYQSSVMLLRISARSGLKKKGRRISGNRIFVNFT